MFTSTKEITKRLWQSCCQHKWDCQMFDKKWAGWTHFNWRDSTV